jgi:hypothetical protein
MPGRSYKLSYGAKQSQRPRGLYLSQLAVASFKQHHYTACCITRHTFNFMDKNITGDFNVQQSPQIALASVPTLQFPRSYLVAAQRRATQVSYGFLVTHV